jgi:hypothetical protein
MTLELVNVTFRLEGDAEDGTLVVFKEPHKVWGVSSETERLSREETPFQLQGGSFVATPKSPSRLGGRQEFRRSFARRLTDLLPNHATTAFAPFCVTPCDAGRRLTHACQQLSQRAEPSRMIRG